MPLSLSRLVTRPHRAVVAVVLACALFSVPTAAQSGGGFNLAGMGHDRGKAEAKVYIVEFGDFGCSYCAKFAGETYPRLDSAYIRPGRVLWKYVPFVTGNFRNSQQVTEAAECAADQKAFWPMHDLIYTRRKEWMASNDINALVARYARELDLNATRFSQCMKSGATRQRIKQNDVLASALYIRATPTFFVNGRAVPGAIPFDLFKQVIDAASR